MHPLTLILTGFRGIRDGLGRDSLVLDLESLTGDAPLVAIAGANGRGKTTIIDNLHPYCVMPSRAGADGLGAFSYYDHVYLPESEKMLVWRHAGIRYKDAPGLPVERAPQDGSLPVPGRHGRVAARAAPGRHGH